MRWGWTYPVRRTKKNLDVHFGTRDDLVTMDFEGTALSMTPAQARSVAAKLVEMADRISPQTYPKPKIVK